MSTLYNHDVYISPYIDFVISGIITEYDISKANANILLSMGIITKELRDYYIALPREQRQIYLGILIRDNKDANRALKEGFIKYRKAFFEANNISDNEVVNIRKDAIYLLNKRASVTVFDQYIEFKASNEYTSYYNISKSLQIFYLHDIVNRREIMDLKGISDDMKHYHADYMIDFFQVLFTIAQTEPIEEVIRVLSFFYNNYINLNLEVGYYRELNAKCLFRYKPTSITTYTTMYADEGSKSVLDISVNREVLERLIKLYSRIHISQIKRV